MVNHRVQPTELTRDERLAGQTVLWGLPNANNVYDHGYYFQPN